MPELAPWNGRRLRLARQLQGLTQREISALVAVSHPMIGQYENGLRVPKADLVSAFAVVLKVQPEFFFEPGGVEFSDDVLNFRDQRTATDRVRTQITAYANFFALALKVMREYVTMPEVRLPLTAPQTIADVERVALEARDFWGIHPAAPIGRMSRVLENAGVAMTSIRLDPNAIERIDALSGYANLGVVLLNLGKESTTRSRFDMAHELGHGIMHRMDGAFKPFELKEQEANAFAGAFLLPRAPFTRDFFTLGRSIDGLLDLKERWGVSVQAILYRAHELQLLNAAEIRVWYQRVAKKGWRKMEPNEPDHETESPEVFDAAIAALGEDPVQVLSGSLGWSPEVLEMVTGIQTLGEPMPGIFALAERRAIRDAETTPQASP
jgi:Zn-dependent peptidase ImmA (M78 family)